MKCGADIIKLAQVKLDDAQLLYDHKRYDSAYYLAGYTIELLLKARVCKTLGIDNFFDSPLGKLKHPQTFKNHDVNQLLLLSGIFAEFQKEAIKTPAFTGYWSVLVKWNEEARYLTGKTQQEAEDLLISVKEIAQWILTHL